YAAYYGVLSDAGGGIKLISPRSLVCAVRHQSFFCCCRLSSSYKLMRYGEVDTKRSTVQMDGLEHSVMPKVDQDSGPAIKRKEYISKRR
ncbi:unnamed protein product, partial [Urochloa humidicola]